MIQYFLYALVYAVAFAASGISAASANDLHKHMQSEHACLDVAMLTGYSVISDTKVIMHMQSGDFVMELENICPQLDYQRYFTFLPVDGHVCASRDRILSRTGDHCMISAIRKTKKTEPLPDSFRPFKQVNE